MQCRKVFLIASAGLISLYGYGQVPEDALRASWNTPSGTARNQAIGGAAGSLGGDISANFVNPAGLGFYKTSELVLSPTFSFYNNQSNYRGTGESSNGSAFVMGTSGLVFGSVDRYRPNRSSAFSVAVNRSADFRNRISYSGQNDYSSFSESYAAEIASSGLSIEQALNSSSISFPARMALYTYLVDTLTTAAAGTEVVGTPLRYAYERDTAFLLNQTNNISTSGGVTEIAVSFAGNNKDKFYWGVSLGIPILNYERNSVLTETDAGNNADSYFHTAELREYYRTKGVGLNLKLGLILKPVNSLRLGLAMHTPTWYGLKETYDASMYTDLENYNSPSQVDVSAFTEGYMPQYRYDLLSPWKFMVSGSWLFNAVEDTRQQRGFITADLEYVTFGSSRFYNSEEETIDNNDYYDAVNNTVKQVYKGALNARLGGEIKFNTFMARAGFAWYGNPYDDSELDGNRMYISGGIGYRNKGFFVDLAYVQRISSDVSFPYRLSDKANTFANIDGTGGTVSATFGIKF